MANVVLVPEAGECFTATMEFAVSPQFFAWLFGFGAEAEIVSHPDIRREAAEQAESILKLYS